MRRLRGLRALVTEAVEHGSLAVERVHKATAARPFAVLEHLPEIGPAARAIHVIHDTSVSLAYGAVRLVNRTVGGALDVALAAAEAGAAPATPDPRDEGP